MHARTKPVAWFATLPQVDACAGRVAEKRNNRNELLDRP
jgi:hypothetical protein